MPTSKKNLSVAKTQEEQMLDLLNQFVDWLIKKKILSKKHYVNYYVEMPVADDDWIMRVDGENVSFNTFLLKKCSFDYFKTIIIHEFFHLVIQRLPNKDDATKLKDDFGDQLLKLIDIQADFFTALFFKEELNYTLVDYFKLYYEGRKVFSDKWIRPLKFERFIGSLLSIFKMFRDNEKNNDVKVFDLYLPTIQAVYTENRLHILVIRKEHIYVDEIKASYQNFVELKECYTNIDTYTMKGYIQGLIKFSCTAFDVEITDSMKKSLEQITT